MDEDLTTGNTKFQCCSLLRFEAACRCTCNPSLREKNDSLIPNTKDGFPCTQIWPSLEISNFWGLSFLAWIISAPALRLPVYKKTLNHISYHLSFTTCYTYKVTVCFGDMPKSYDPHFVQHKYVGYPSELCMQVFKCDPMTHTHAQLIRNKDFLSLSPAQRKIKETLCDLHVNFTFSNIHNKATFFVD